MFVYSYEGVSGIYTRYINALPLGDVLPAVQAEILI